MPYHATGESRDSYITGVRPGCRYGAAHDVEKRRDNLPDNVFSYIKEGAQWEQRQQRIDEEARARTRLEMFARPPKARGGAAAGSSSGSPQATASSQVRRLEQESANRERHAALTELYARERQEWEEKLGNRGLAIQRA
ncbi:hypothetical protein ABB37_09714 [Leptomonas pyrrhocoris]|uniref:Uncharacterized protein n=1 Tax=Leptomonas pyrrhocoris TaxID=157538 RepID=A0A0N0VCV2_LEPPY|nr:hypothetical protein ABB37_09714 [Leptomonas pyrrhocoris]KPA73582.1 hypothetical protein ABB37_09714 [Leptomonas pyrrhocoris]|eukprot:XP_015652021.1 hypothetical protein ABB37_09714 [Leptomonas pyrrhocoris]